MSHLRNVISQSIGYQRLNQQELEPDGAEDDYLHDHDQSGLFRDVEAMRGKSVLAHVSESGDESAATSELVSTKRRSGLQKVALLVGGALLGALIAILILLAIQHGHRSKGTPASVANEHTRPAINASDTDDGLHLRTPDLLQGRYYASTFNGTWISDHELIYRDDVGNLRTYDARSQESTILLDGEVGDLLQAADFQLSADRKYVLYSKNVQRIFRHSSLAYYDVVEVATKKVQSVGHNSTAVDYLQLVQWSTVGNGLVFVQANNIFYKPTMNSAPVQITEDGSRSVGYGTSDWVYEEEVFASKSALWFSPDGRRLAFVRFDDTQVPVMNIPVYGEPGRPESQYTQLIGLHYPKVGAPNPTVALYSVDLAAATVPHQTIVRHEQTVPEPLRREEHIISTVGWQNNETFVSAWMNRIQNRAYLQACRDSSCTVFKTISSSTGWVDLFKPLQFDGSGKFMELILSHDQFGTGNQTLGGFRHVTLVSTGDGRETVLTSGAFEVRKILHWDRSIGRIFYSANQPGLPEVQHVFAVKTEAGARSDCLTCGLAVNGVNQTFFSAEFSTGRYAVISSTGPDVPQVALYEWSVNADRVQLRQLAVLDDNADVQSTIRGIPLPQVSFIDVPLDHDNFTARVRIMVPADVDRSGRTKYPMLVNVYAGPDSYNGDTHFMLDWGSVLVSTRKIVHVQINGRGSGLRGDRLRDAIYRRFGQVEVDDQIEVTGKLVKLLPYVDAEHVVIWGWSYGGFASAMALAKDHEHLFRCAASVAPVTDFRLYDSIYTERFMGLPSGENNNAAGYEATAVYNLAEQFRNRSFFLVHGTFDDNVHYQQSMALSRSLEVHDVMFRQMSYPDEGHSLGSVQTHLYHTLGQYFDECFST